MPMNAEQSSAQKTGIKYRKIKLNERKSNPVPSSEEVPNLAIEKPVDFMFFKSFI